MPVLLRGPRERREVRKKQGLLCLPVLLSRKKA